MVRLATLASNEYINSTYFWVKGNISSLGYNKDGENDGEGEQNIHRLLRIDFGPLASQLFFKTDTENDMTRGNNSLFQYFTTYAETLLGPCSNLYACPLGSEDEIRRARMRSVQRRLRSSEKRLS